MEKNYIQNNGKAKGKIYIGLDHGYGAYKETGSGASAGGGIRREYGPYTCC